MQVISVPHDVLPYVAVNVTFRRGASQDPPGQEGLAYLTAEMLLRGTQRRSRAEFLGAVHQLGTSINVSAGEESIRLSADCAAEHLPALLELMAEAILEPAFSESELSHLQRRTIATLAEMRDDDSAAASLFFTAALFQGHPYAGGIYGYAHTLLAVERDDLAAFHAAHYCVDTLVVAMAGAVDKDEAQRFAEGLEAKLPAGKPGRTTLSHENPRSCKVVHVTHPERSQAQVLIGQAALPGRDSRLLPGLVAVTGFGGTFTSRLVREIREKRGWSYGVGASLQAGLHTGFFQMRFAPRNEDLRPALELSMQLLEELVSVGPSEDEIKFAARYLVQRFPFHLETILRRLNVLLNVTLTGKPTDYIETFCERVEDVDASSAVAALQSFLFPARQTIVVVADASVGESLAEFAGKQSVLTVPSTWDKPLPDMQ